MEPCRNCGQAPGDPYCHDCTEEAFAISPGFLRTTLMQYFGGWDEKPRAKALRQMVRTMPEWAKRRRERRDGGRI